MPTVKDFVPPALTAPVATSRPAGAAVGTGPANPGRTTHDARLKDAARQFEADFMTEMLRHARPSPKAAGAFAPGQSEETWRVMMDQALGQAATTGGPAGAGSLRQVIEKALRDAESPGGKGAVK